MIQLRLYQSTTKNEIKKLWERLRCVLAALPTGSGKTVIMSDILREHVGAACAIAHRQELVQQISKALGANEIYHNILAPEKVIREINRVHIEEFGRSYYNPNSQICVAGVDTLRNRAKLISGWLSVVSLWVIDEAHHVVQGNKWGKVVELFPNARGLGVTATPIRADGKGLHKNASGHFEDLVEGPHMRELINQGFLSDYKIFSPPTDLDLSNVKVSDSTGDYVRDSLKKAVQSSSLIRHEGEIVGDVVMTYKKLALGKKGVTFATDVETAIEISRQFNLAGVRSEIVSAKTPDAERNEIIRRFRKGDLMQLVNVDLFGEGFDLPAIEVVSMARPTKSYSLYIQQFGRALRPLPGKEYAIIIDHVGNVFHFAKRHGKPCSRQIWDLNDRERRSSKNEKTVPYKACANCMAVYERHFKICPDCGFEDVPAKRSDPKFVDGDLYELDADILDLMKKQVADVDKSVKEFRQDLNNRKVPDIAIGSQIKYHLKRQKSQRILRNMISWWAGWWKHNGLNDSQMYRKFYISFGVDVMTAQTLKPNEADGLTEKIENELKGTPAWHSMNGHDDTISA